MFGGAFWVLRVGGALEHIWGIGWYLEAHSFGYWNLGGVLVHISRL